MGTSLLDHWVEIHLEVTSDSHGSTVPSGIVHPLGGGQRVEVGGAVSCLPALATGGGSGQGSLAVLLPVALSDDS
jgi:hypothetical protein